MRKLFIAFFLSIAAVSPAQAMPKGFETTQRLVFVAETNIPGRDQQKMSLCHVTESFTALALPLTTFVKGYVLSNDKCVASADRPFSPEQMVTAQSLKLIAPEIPTEAKTSLEQNLWNYGFWSLVVLVLVGTIWSKSKLILGFTGKGPLRPRAAKRVLSALCHVAKIDGHVAASEIRTITQTAERLTQHKHPNAEILRMVDKVKLDLTAHDYIAFGKGLRDHEKDIMVHGVLYVAIADGKMQPTEYEFATQLAHYLGMPPEDFHRMLDMALADMDKQSSNL